MRLLIVMSVAGTIPLIAYFFLRLFASNWYSDQSRMFFLKMSIFFFLCPFQRLKYLLPAKLHSYLGFLFPERPASEKMYLKREGYVLTGYLSGEYRLIPRWQMVLRALRIFAIVLFLSSQIMKYRKLKKILKRSSQHLDDRKIIGWISGVPQMEKLYRRKKVICMQNQMLTSPFTVGIFHPWIVFPGREIDKDSREMILCHELTHIKNKDILAKYLCFVVVLLHCFNPASWILFYVYGVESEYRCDNAVISSRSSWDEKKKYAQLITEMAVQDDKIPITFTDFLSKGERIMENRIRRILGSEKNKKRVAPLLGFAVFIMCCFTSVAYRMPLFADKEEYMDLDGYTEVYYLFDFDDEFLKEKVKFANSDTVFIDEEENIYDLSPDSDLMQDRACDHTYISGSIQKYSEEGKEGCTIIIYSATYCTKCKHIKSKKEISRASYNPCIHLP